MSAAESQAALLGFKTSGINCNEYFTVNEDYMFGMTANIDVKSDQKLIIIYTLPYSETENYMTKAEIIISSDGAGGSDYTKYLNSEFKKYFDDLSGRKLIDSTADKLVDGKLTEGSAYRFRTLNQAVKIDMTITTQGVTGFCNIVKTQTGIANIDQYFQIDINVDNIPAKNTEIGVKFVIYFGDAPTAEDSYLEYSFIIPGIYKLDRDFNDANLYNFIINYKSADGTKYVYESYSGYLLTDGAGATADEFDATGLSGNIDLTGLNYLSDTKSFRFDNCNIYDLLPFSLMKSDIIISLSLTNCGLTNDKIKDYISKFRSLEFVDLSGNDITSISYNGKCILYRALKTLDISAQKNLNTLIGFENLTELSTLDVSNDSVKEFKPLIDMPSLRTVYLYGNAADNFSGADGNDNLTYFGTEGKINVPTFVELIGKGVAVYKYDRVTKLAIGGGEKDISLNENIGALALDSIVTFSKYYYSNGIAEDINLPDSVIVDNADSGLYFKVTTRYYIVDNAAVLSGQVSPAENGKTVQIIISVTVNTLTVYRMITLEYFTA